MSALHVDSGIALAGAALLGVAAIYAAADEPVASGGKQLYAQYCAACHGVQGHGDGPVASSLAVEVPDLTLMAHRHGGSFPRELIERIIDGRYILGAHGTRVMPVWGEDLSRLSVGDPHAEEATSTVTSRLADYVRSLQRPATDSNPEPGR